jgi:hypothetical protein
MSRGRTSSKLDAPVVIVFKTSNRSNAQTKMKIFRNKSIDEVLDENSKLPGVPDNAEWLEIGLGESFIESYSKKYNI